MSKSQHSQVQDFVVVGHCGDAWLVNRTCTHIDVPLGRPKCEHRMTFAPCSNRNLVVGTMERKRVSSVTVTSSCQSVKKSTSNVSTTKKTKKMSEVKEKRRKTLKRILFFFTMPHLPWQEEHSSRHEREHFVLSS